MFFAPTGRFRPGGSDNIGLGFWSQYHSAGYYYPKTRKVKLHRH